MQTKINITFSVACINRFAVRRIIRKCIETTLSSQNVELPCEVNVLVTDDAEIRTINKASRDVDKATDVLSFPMFDLAPGECLSEDMLDPETGLCPLGDMAISLERAIAQAEEFGHTAKREIGYLTIHSVLHLLGYDHMDEGPMKAQMRQKEEEVAARIPGMQRT